MRKNLISLSIGISTVLAAEAALALDSNAIVPTDVSISIDCEFIPAFNGTSLAAVAIQPTNPDVILAYLLPAVWGNGEVLTNSENSFYVFATPTSILEGCFNNEGEILNWQAFSADASSYQQEDKIGFSFDYQPLQGGLAQSFSFIIEQPDADATLEAGSGTEASTISTTADTQAEAVNFLDFTLRDGGGEDAMPLSVTSLDVNISGTDSGNASKLTWLLNGPDTANVEGVFSGGSVTFSDLSVEVADGGSETYTISAYFNDNTGLTEGQVFALTIDGDTDVTVASGSTTFGATDAVTNGSGATITVEGTQLAFTTQPAGSTSGSALSTQPIVTAQDAAGNTDTDFTGTVALSEASAGTLSGNTATASNGVATFTSLSYTATADQQDFTLTASSGTLSAATSNSVTSDVVATVLTFSTQPAPTSFPGNQAVTFSTVPVVQAVDANSVVDNDFTDTVTLSEVDGAGSATFSNGSVNAAAGVATFTGLGLTYTNSGTTTETFKLEASSGSLTAAQSSDLTARLAPTVTGVSSSTADGSYKAGETISIQVTFSDEVIVSGTPQLTLETGTTDRIATYAEGSGTSTLTFTYTVQVGDDADDLDYTSTTALSANGGTIRSKVDADVDAVLTLATPGATGSLGAANALVIDTTDPAGYSASLDQDPINDGNKSSVSFTFADAEVGAYYSFTISSTGGGTNVTGSGTIATATDQITGIDVSGLGDGTLTLSVALTDAAGNVGSAATDTSSKDASLPSGHTVAFDQSTVNDGNKNAISFTFADAEVGANYSFTISSSVGVTNVTGSGTIATATDQITGIDVSGLGDGTLTLSITLTDAAGNSASAVTDTVVKDALTPDAPSTPVLAEASNSGSTGDNLTNNATPTITGTAETSATVEIFVGSISVGTSTADGSGNWSFTFTAQDLASGTNSITAKATDAAGNTSAASAALVITLDADAPTVTITGPMDVVTTDFTVTLTFSEVVTGFAADDITVTNGAKGTFTETTPGKVFTLVVTPELGTTVAVSIPADKAQDAAGNGNEASDVFEVTAGSPASEFEKESAEINTIILNEVQNTLQNAITANVRLVKRAKGLFIASQKTSSVGSSGNVPFDVDGVAEGTAMRLSTRGTFFGQVGNDEGTKRRTVSGDFSIVGEKGGSVTGSISGKVAWEQNLSDKTMYGYFIGAQVNQTDIKTTFTGKQQGYGVNIGSYVVNEVAENVYIDGFVSLGMGKSDLDMSNDVLSLDGTYETKSATIGGGLTGVYDMKSFEFWPELAFTAGKTQIGNAKFTGRAYGLVDNNLSSDAGDVTVANLTLRPEVRVPLESGIPNGATTQVTFAPRAICERITTDVTKENCGSGAELGFIRRSGDGLTQITGRLSRDYVGTSTRTGLELKLEHRF